jgi:hypothetical protein
MRPRSPTEALASEILLIDIDEAIKNKQMSRDVFAKLVPIGQVRSVLLSFPTVLDRERYFFALYVSTPLS